MKFKKQRDEEERLERAAKIKAHLKKNDKTAPQYPDDEPLNWSQEEQAPRLAEGSQPAAPKAVQPRIYPPLQPWEKLDRWGRRYQARPLTRAEHEAVEDAAFLKKQFDADQAYREKVRKAEAELEAEEKATKKQAEREARTGMRPYEPGRYCSLEEARRRGLISSCGDSNGSGNEWSAPGNPEGLFGGGR